jgi:hypothetical protein
MNIGKDNIVMIRGIIVAGAAGVLLLALGGCSKKQDSGHSATLGSATGSAAGVVWSIPARWQTQGQRQMRVATYAIPAVEGDSEPAECAVFYFGSEQGGSVDANIDRWYGQFSHAASPERGTMDVGGLKVTTVAISGAYLAPSGPMMAPTGEKENYRLLGAIVEAPQGLVFFKLTGPAKTVDAAHADLNGLVGSLTKQG